MKNFLCFLLGFVVVLSLSLPFAFAELQITHIIYDIATDTPIRIGYTLQDTKTGYESDFPLGGSGGRIDEYTGVIFSQDWHKRPIEPPIKFGTDDYYNFLNNRTWVKL